MKKYLGFATVILSLFVFAKTARAESFTAYLNAAQEVPTNGSTGTGTGTVVVNAASTSLTFTVTYTGLTSAQILAHIHAPGAIGANGPIAIDLGVGGGTSGTLRGHAPINATQLAQLRAGLAYINIHTSNNPGGEIRGQLASPRRIPVSVVDFDGDRKTDFSVLRFPNAGLPAVAQITYYNLRSTSGAIGIAFGDANRDFPAPGDFDGDGKDDLALYREGVDPGDASFFLILKSSDDTFQAVHWGITGDQPIARDYDGDGITDMAVFRRGSNAGDPAFWYIRQSTNGLLRAVQWGTTGDLAGGTSGDAPVPGDYDGDGKFDVAVYRFGELTPTNAFLILRSSDGGLKFQAWGNFATDYIVPGDFDGDGKTDFVAARTGEASTDSMVWYILRSVDGTLAYSQFGLSSDMPAQGDYDGDNRTDIAVYRGGADESSQSTFFYLGSLDNAFHQMPWGLGSDFAVNTFDIR